jgi:hypothetical protein
VQDANRKLQSGTASGERQAVSGFVVLVVNSKAIK